MTAVPDDLKTYMAGNSGAVIEDVARERKVTPRTVLEALPSGMARVGGGEASPKQCRISQHGVRSL